ncbi:hypothetical protein [Anaeroarcus burkinensis]|uniref:hypothetical protein n=1 Tax=Anaeroarcus burkinensis TaxID=82376 RepID=UPI000428097A|nr:hypothetical protein [Anaeroarcus burkinensis]
MRRKTNAFVLLLFLLLSLYWGYQHYQTKQYTAAILPTYQAMGALHESLEAIYELGDNDEQLLPGQIAECGRIQNTLLELEAQLSETNPPTSGAAKIKQTLTIALGELQQYSAAHAQYLKDCLTSSQKSHSLTSLGKQVNSANATYASLAEYTAAFQQAKLRQVQLEEKKEAVTLARTSFLTKAKKDIDTLLQ